MANLGTLRRISPKELEDVIAQARDERWTELVLVGPNNGLHPNPEQWPEHFRSKTVFQVTAQVGSFERLINQLTYLERLSLWSIEVGVAGAEAIAANLKRLARLDLSNNQVGNAGAGAIATNLKQLVTLDLSNNEIGASGALRIAVELNQLTALVLWGNHIGDLGAKAIATNLKQLRTLDLSNNQIGDEGAEAIATNLKQLGTLDLSNNQIGDEGAEAIAAHLKQLTTLDLGHNQIGDAGVEAIAANLAQLTTLVLWGNQIGAAGAQVIATHLKHLTTLMLWDNQIGAAGAEAIAANLTHLTTLDLSDNHIGTVGAEAIAANLTQLTILMLRGNHIGDIGVSAIATNLKRLTTLVLWGNQIGASGAGAIAANLSQLTRLDLSDNQIGDAGARAIAAELKQLTTLNLSRNQIGDAGVTDIGMHLTGLESLELAENTAIRSVVGVQGLTKLLHLNLAKTSVSDLSPLRSLIERGIRTVWKQYGGSGINVLDCPLVHPTPEIVRQGHEAVLNYFREMDRQGVDHLYEAKVLLVGGGGAGKTSLLRRLYYPEMQLPGDDESTHGIEIHQREFHRANGGAFRLNLWDFGGQQIYHATHQFFLTKNSLYVLVDDTRTDHKSVRDEGFKYWLEVVEVFGANSPVLIFQNEKTGRSKKIDDAGIKGRFPNVKDTLRGDLAVPGAADGLRRAIEHFVQALPHVGEAVPAKWVSVRGAIEEIAKQKPHISLDEYFALYATFLEPDRKKALFLSQYLHDLGVFLHFQDDLRLQKTVIVQNCWATEAVFRILDDEIVKQRPGRFTIEDCGRVWASSEYADMHLELLALMEKFELCFRLPDCQPDTWLVPQLLCPSSPEYVSSWSMPEDLALNYRYEFLPRGLTSRLLVRMHRFAAHYHLCWANGALFEREQTQLLACASDRGDEIMLRARGPESKALLSVIANALDELNETFRGLEGKVSKRVPCICSSCGKSTTPEYFQEKHLLKRKAEHKPTIECRESGEDVSVITLLDGLRMEQKPGWAMKSIKVFLASSEELRVDRDAFDLYFRQQNDRFINRGFYLEVVRWENFLDAMSDTRLQNEYNAAVRKADIFVSLFATKTGKFTEEEFDVAHEAFKSASKPLIYTFFKDVQVPANAEGHEALTTLINFQRKLGGLGHFWTMYQSTDDLKLKFKDQLEKLEVKGWGQ